MVGDHQQFDRGNRQVGFDTRRKVAQEQRPGPAVNTQDEGHRVVVHSCKRALGRVENFQAGAAKLEPLAAA